MFNFHAPRKSGKVAQGAGTLACALAMAFASQARADYNLPADAATINGTNIAVDGHCNLTEAVASVNAGHAINSDCHPTGSTPSLINLTASFSSTPVYQLASGITVTSTIYISTPSEYPAVVEAPGAAVFTVNAGASLAFSDIVVQHKAGSQGRVIVNHGSLTAYFSTFQNGDISSSSWPANGAGIYNDGDIPALGYCVIKNNKAPNGSGGGIYNRGWIGSTGAGLNHTAISNNIAAQGGGIYSVRNSGTVDPQGQLTLDQATLNDNKAIASEVTSGGTIFSGGGNSCNTTTEMTASAFDDNFNTKWCATSSAPPSTSAPMFIIYQFPGGAKQRVQSYSVTSANDAPERDPTDWTLAGSNTNGGPWTTLDTRAGQTFTVIYNVPASKGGRYLTKTFYFNNANAYAFYRFQVTKNNGSNTADPFNPGSGTPSKIMQFAELQLYPDWKTGDGGGLFYTTHARFDNSTFSRNIAGCTNASCACPAGDDFCANPSNTNMTWGRGGAILAATITPENGYNDPGETFAKNLTVAGNSASQGGGFYQSVNDHWAYRYSIFGKNNARTNVSKEPDFHGIPRTQDLDVGGNIFSNSNGLVTSQFPGGFSTTGIDRDIVADPKLKPLASEGGTSPLLIHMPMAGSPAIDGIPSNTEGSPAQVDQRNYSRPTGPNSDFGSIEKQPSDP